MLRIRGKTGKKAEFASSPSEKGKGSFAPQRTKNPAKTPKENRDRENGLPTAGREGETKPCYTEKIIGKFGEGREIRGSFFSFMI